MPISSAYQEQQKAQQEIANNAPSTSSQTSQPAQQPQPQNAQEWDYKTSPVNQKGQELPAGARGWTPFGSPYFGAGIGGTLKRYAWSFMGSPVGQEDGRWEKFLELTQSQDYGGAAKEMAAGVFGTDKNQETAATDWGKVKEANARIKQLSEQYRTPNGVNLNMMPEDVRAEFEELQQTVKSSTASAAEGATSINGISLLSPLVKGSKVAVQATLDVLSEAAIKFEQMQGVTSAMRDYAQENSSLPALAANIDRTQGSPSDMEGFQQDPALVALKSESAQEVANITSRLLLPVLNGWDAMRFWTAPGTLKQKQAVLQSGWDAGRVLYSQAIKPSLLAEFKRRAAAGEDPQLLAMELQNPWAEAIGQAVLDPLNFVGLAVKTAKSVNMLDDATDAVRGGTLGDEAAELLAKAGDTPLGETVAAQKLDEFDATLTKNIDRVEQQRLTVDFNKATSYSPSGLRVRESKTVATVSNVVTASIMRGGGSADDVADFFSDMSKAVSADKATRLEAWDRLMSMSNRFGLGRYIFSDDVLETGVLLRNLVEDKDLLTALRAGKGDLAETAKILNRKFQQAVEKQIMSYTDVKKLAEDFRTGVDTSKRAEKAAETYKGIKRKALWNLHEGTIGKAKQSINSFLGKFYFSQPGFMVRNASGNFTTMFVDGGFVGTAKSFYRDGKYWSMSAVEDDLRRWFGGNLPPAVTSQTLTQAEKSSTGITALNEKVENAFATRIYWRQFKDTMDKMLTPGVALPKREQFKAVGLTDDMIDEFVETLRSDAYGNTDEAIRLLAERSEPWKKWRGALSPEEVKGVNEIGLTKEINDVVDNAQTPAEIKEGIAKLKREATTRANSATDNPIGVNAERKGFEFVEGLGKATEQGLMDVDGTNKLNILIEQSERATDELMQAIGKARNVVTDPVLREQFGVMEEAFSATRRGAARQTSQQLTDTAWDLTRKARKATGIELERLWNKSILAKRGPAPKGLTQQQFLDELWQATRNDVSNNWETYFAEGFDKLTPLIDNLTEQFPELGPIFAKSQKASAELNIYRTATYRDGKIFYQKPPQNIRELASRYGIATATEAGIPQDRQLLATINKYSGQKYKTLDEVPLEEAEKALQARKAGAMTTADAARVEAPKTATETVKAPATDPKTFTRDGGYEQVENAKALKSGDVITVDGRDWTVKDVKVRKKSQTIYDDLDPTAPAKGTEEFEVVTVNLTDGRSLQSSKLTVGGADKFNASKKAGAMTQADAARVEQPKAGGEVVEAANKTPSNIETPEFKNWFGDSKVVDESGQPKIMYHATGEDFTSIKGGQHFGTQAQSNQIVSSMAETVAERTKRGLPPEKSDAYKTIPVYLSIKNPMRVTDDVSSADDWARIIEDAKAKGHDGIVYENWGEFDPTPAGNPADSYIAFNPEQVKSAASKGFDPESPNLIDELGEIRDPSPNPEVQISPPYVDGSPPIPGQMWKENSDGIQAALNKVEAHMLDNYGMQGENLNASQLKALKGLMKESGGKITEGMAIADKIGKEWRDFALLPYGETKNFDLALSYVFPYQFWYSRSYSNWMKRVATDPQVIANYARIKESMSRINKDSPEWWRYNVEIPSHFLGLPNEHPMSFNLEANIWPLYGLMGADFNDPQKRQNWFTATVDDMGKMGPSIWAPIQWGIALAYKAQGEDELAQAWGGRIIPQTALAKNLTSTFFGKPIEFDPGVQLFSGKGIMDFSAMDKYERNRVGRALTAMVQDGILTEEQAVEVARTQEGPAWDAAVKRAVDIRTPGAITSFLFGVGMKARTEEDRVTDEFYEKYYRLQNLNEADLISPEQYQTEWDGLRQQYPFMDALLLSRKAGPDRDRAYAYNVLGRIPPGQAGELYKLVGITPEIAQKFYDSKGNIAGWSESDREKFIAATVDLGAMLAIPEFTTKQDWNAARNAYKGVQEGMKQNFGADIQDKIDEYFSLQDTEDRDRYIKSNPQVTEALAWQNEQVVNDELLYQFYGGIQSLEKFHRGKVYDQLEKTYGADIQDKFNEYYDMQVTDPEGAKRYYRQHPELKKYNEEKKKLMAVALRSIVEFGSKLPEEEKPELTGNTPESVGQQNVQDYATQTTPSFEFWTQELPEVTSIIADFWQNDEEIPYAVTKNLDYMASNYGYESGDDLLQAILISMNR